MLPIAVRAPVQFDFLRGDSVAAMANDTAQVGFAHAGRTQEDDVLG